MTDNSMIEINEQRLIESLLRMNQIGNQKNGGITRLALSDEDREARLKLSKWCEKLGLSVRVDDVGNMYARYEGKRNLPPLLIGSHLDSVLNGGRFDGVYGVLAELEVIKTLKENGIVLDYPVELVNFTNEEGARFEPSMLGSGVVAGVFSLEEVYKQSDRQGTSFKNELDRIGFCGSSANRITEAAAYFELHIEQGPVLAEEKKQIGVVEGITGITCFQIKIQGEANHAGTTPMRTRKDALVAASYICLKLPSIIKEIDQDLVGTIGRFDVMPNIYNVVPGEIVFTVDLRHSDKGKINKASIRLKKMISEIEKIYLVSCQIETLWETSTTWFTKELINKVRMSTERRGYSWRKLMAGAGHDAQYMAQIVPTTMIFIPSLNGKSHCPEENSRWEDCKNGANVLLQVLLEYKNQNRVKI